MKRFIVIAILIIVSVTAAVLTSGVLNKKTPAPAADNTNTAKAPAPIKSGQTALNPAEIARHNKPADCWIAVDSRVYDFTKIIKSYPDNISAITSYCGKNGTPVIKGLLADLYVGEFDQSAAPKPAADQNSRTPAASALTLSLIEIAKHAGAADCWMAIESKVFNFTPYISTHPGGAATMLPYCGRDGGAGFATKDKNSAHSAFAQSLLANYYLGNLNQTVNNK